MKVDLLSKFGEPQGQIDIPDEVVSAANRVNSWLQQQSIKGGVLILCGVTLADPIPSMTVAKVPDVAPPETQERIKQEFAKRGFWWNCD